MPAKSPTLWTRFTSRLRRLLVGESFSEPVSFADLYGPFRDGYGLPWGIWPLVDAWRRRPPPESGAAAPALRSAAQARDVARLLESYNPYAQAILSALRSYVLGDKGLDVEVRLAEDDEGYDVLVEAAQAYLDDFMDRTDWWSREREMQRRIHRDGECVLRYFADRDGIEVRFVEPEWIVAPDPTPEWTDGVLCAAGDSETLVAIWVQTGLTPSDGEAVPASECYFAKANADRCMKRGLSDFASISGVVADTLDCISTMIRAEANRQGVLYVEQYNEKSGPDVEQANAARADYTATAYSQQGAGRTVQIQVESGVRKVTLPGGMNLAAPPTSGSVTNASEAINTALLSVGSRYHMPLWLISGDASRNNALDLQAEGPWGRFVADEQAWFSREVRNALWRVLEIAVDRGELPGETLTLLDVIVTPQKQTEMRDPTKESLRNQILFQNGIMGKPEWCLREGLDWEQQDKDIKEYGGPPVGAGPRTPAGAWQVSPDAPQQGADGQSSDQPANVNGNGQGGDHAP